MTDKQVIAAVIIWELMSEDGETVFDKGDFTSCELSDEAHAEIIAYIKQKR